MLKHDQKKIRENIQTEVDASYLYKLVSELEKDEEIASYYSQMSKIEKGHALKSIEKAAALHLSLDQLLKPSWRAKVIGKLGRMFGSNLILSILLHTEKSISQATLKTKSSKGEKLVGNENRHVEILKSIQQLNIGKLSKIEKRHRHIGGNALRAAVLGANDGLVSNMCLVMGVAGASTGTKEIVIAGLAGLLAGAFSMALGEWISVKSSQELYEKQIQLEMEEIENSPEEEKQELILLYKAKGFSEEEANLLAEKAFADTKNTHAILLKEELGVNADELQSSPWEAAIASFIFFVIGAIIPVISFLFLSGNISIVISLVCSIAALFLMGASITLFTGRSVWMAGLRQILFGLLAAAITFGIGKLIGVSIQ